MNYTSLKSWCVLIVALAALYGVVEYVIPGVVGATEGSSSTECNLNERELIADGLSPERDQWRIVGTVRDNGGCERWLLGVEFYPAGVPRGSWRGAWDIPADGHLPSGFGVAAQDEALGSGRVVSGIVGDTVRSVHVRTKGGRVTVIHPQLPSHRSRKRAPWIKGMRYFMWFYDKGAKTVSISLFNAKGKRVSVVSGEEGLFRSS